MSFDLSSPKLRDFKSFVAGSSILCTLVTFAYVGLAWRKKRPAKFSYEIFAVALPFLFGIWNVVLNRIPASSSKNYTIKMVVGGAVFGLFLSFLGSRVLDVPKTLNAFGFPKQPHLPIMTAWVLYAAVWGIIVNLVNRGVGLA